MKLIAPIPGKVEELAFEEGKQIQRGEVALYMESMKMKIPVYAKERGSISYHVEVSDVVSRGDVLAEIDEETEARSEKSDK